MSTEQTQAPIGTPITQDRLFRLAFALAVLCSVAFQGSRGLYESTEGRYAECARQTLESGNFLEPMLNGEHHWTKPPLTYLAIGGGLKLLGDNTWGVRAFLAVCFILTVMAVYILGRFLWGNEAAGWSALIYATSPFTVASANAVSTDAMLVLWQTCSMAFFWAAIRTQKIRYTMLMWAALGLAVLTKGPMGFVPLVGFVPIYFVLRRRGISVPGIFNPAGWAIFGTIGITWYLYAIVRHPELLDYWVMHETIGRMVQGEFNRNSQTYKILTMYVPIMLGGTGIWAFLLLLNRRRFSWPQGRWMRWLSWDDGVEWTYLLVSVIVPFLAFSVSQSRLPLYLLPLFVPLSVMMGKGLSLLVENGVLRQHTLVRIACASALILVGAKGVSSHIASRNDMKQLAAEIAPILERHPGYALKLMQKEPLNGLQFYLRREIPLVKLDELPAGQDLKDLVQGDTLLLLRSKYLKYCEEYIRQGLIRLEFKNEYWAVAVPAKTGTGNAENAVS